MQSSSFTHLIDPSNIDNDTDLTPLNEILKQEYDPHVSKKLAFHSKNYLLKLKYSLVKHDDVYYVVTQKLDEGSQSKVKLLPVAYKKNSEGDYQPHEENELVIKKMLFDTKAQQHLESFDFSELNGVVESKKQELLWEKFKEQAEHEVKMLKAAGDQKAALIIDETKKYVAIIQTKSPGILLEKYIKENPNLNLRKRLHLIRLISEKVAELHAKGIAHLDLKPSNMMYDEKSDILTLIDFGSAQLDNTNLSSCPRNLQITTPLYDSPCHLQNAPKQIDAYSLAGIYGYILNKEVIQKKSQVRVELLMAIAYNDAFAENFKLQIIPYEFERILSSTLISQIDSEQLSNLKKIVTALQALGSDNFKERCYAEKFNEVMKRTNFYKQDILMNTPLNQLKRLHEEVQQVFSKFIQHKSIKNSKKLNVRQFVSFVQNGLKDDTDTESIANKLNKIMAEVIAKQKQPQLGKLFSSHMGRSKALLAIVELPANIKDHLDQSLLKDAEQYSKWLWKRTEHTEQVRSAQSI